MLQMSHQQVFFMFIIRTKGGIHMLDGCQGKPRTPTIIEKVCPNCGHEIELFSIDNVSARFWADLQRLCPTSGK